MHQLVQTTVSSGTTAVAVIVIDEQKLSRKLHTRKTGFGHQQYGFIYIIHKPRAKFAKIYHREISSDRVTRERRKKS